MAVASWLADFKGLSSQEIQDFSKKIVGDGHLKSELFKLLKTEKNPEKLDPVIHQLFSFYRLDNDLLQRFALEFVPSILYNYFHSIYSTDHKSGASIEALLLGIYNIDAAKSQEEYLIDKTPPSSFLNISSVYHNPMHSDVPTRLTKITLEKLQQKDVHNCHNLEHVDSITNRNRLLIISHSLMRYNHDIAFYSSVSHLDICHLCTLFIKPTTNRINMSTISSAPSIFPFSFPRFTKLKSEAKANPPSSSSSILPSLPVSEDLISQLLHAVFFIMYNDLPDEGYLALESLYFRAIYDLLPHSILATSAVYNLLHSQGKTEGKKLNLSPLELTITVPPPTNKDAITGASFKPHILPEDIEVKDVAKETSTPASYSLFGTAIGEELSTAMKMRQKSVISKVFHIPMAKRKDDAEKKEEEKFAVSASLSSPPQSGMQFSIAKKALKNPFKSEQQTSTTPASAAASMARLEFLTKRDTISITPYFSQLDSSETSPNLPVSKTDKKHKSKGSKLRRKHLKRAPSSGSSTSPKHSLSVSSYLSKDVIQERNEVTKSDVDDEEEEEDDEQVECQDEAEEIVNESDAFVDAKTRQTPMGNNVASFQNQIGKRHLLLRHITFANNADSKEYSQVEAGARQPFNRYDSDKGTSTKEADDIDNEAMSSDMPLLERRDSVPRLVALVTDKGDASEDGDDDDDHGLEQDAAELRRLIHDP